MEKSNFFALMSRMKFISRWGLMRSTIPENIQEHSLNVSMLAHALAVIGREIFRRDIDPGLCAAAALYHDAPEILTGDLPTPVKYFNPAIARAYKEVERSSSDRLIEMLPETLKPAYSELFRCEELHPEVYAYVKAADRLSAYIKCLEELRSGNSEFKQAAAQILESIKKIQLPEVGYFMEHFIDGYTLSLDELN